MKSWGYYILAAIGFVVFAAVVDVERDDSVAIVDGGNVDSFNLQVGDCFNDAGTFVRPIVSDPSVPCSDPHDNEAYAVFDVSYDSYPADGKMDQLARDACMLQFESFVGKEYDKSPLLIGALHPTADGWGRGHREVVCAVFKMHKNQLVGSAAGPGL